jgi:competence protein ComEA
MPLSQVPRPPEPSRLAALLGRRSAFGDGDPPAERLEAELRAARRPGLVTVPEQVRFGRVRVPTAAVVAVLALVLAAACLFLVRVLWAERAAGAAGVASPAASPTGITLTSAPVAPTPSGGTSDPAPTGSSGGTDGPGDALTEQVVVHVVGQVARPGLVRLRPGARVADAITEAGGPTKQADLAALNLARLVTDGEQVHVPRPGETPPVPQGPSPPGHASEGTGGTAGGGGGAGGGPVNLNSADQATLETLPGVGPVLAQRILEWRTEHGRFTSVEELREVSGIGDKVFAKLAPKVTV